MLGKSGENGCHWAEGNDISLLPSNSALSCRSFRRFSASWSFLGFFIMNGCWILLKFLFSFFLICHMPLLFFLVSMMNYIMWFGVLNHHCKPGVNPLRRGIEFISYIAWFYFLVWCWGFLHLCSWVILVCGFPFLEGLHLALVFR